MRSNRRHNRVRDSTTVGMLASTVFGFAGGRAFPPPLTVEVLENLQKHFRFQNTGNSFRQSVGERRGKNNEENDQTTKRIFVEIYSSALSLFPSYKETKYE